MTSTYRLQEEVLSIRNNIVIKITSVSYFHGRINNGGQKPQFIDYMGLNHITPGSKPRIKINPYVLILKIAISV